MSETQRRPSFGNMLLRRSKSGEFGKGKKAQALKEAELERQRQASANRKPPKLPAFSNSGGQLSKSFGDDLGPQFLPQPPSRSHHSPAPDVVRPSMEASFSLTSSVPVPPVPNGGFDPYARTESMTNRGRYSYASSAVSTVNSPRRVRRRKDPTPFNILVVGYRNAGKTSFLEFLKTALALPPKKRTKKSQADDIPTPAPASGNFIPHYLETEIDGERVGLTIWDSEGLEKNVIDLQLREMSAFLESKFEETFNEEMKVIRSPGVQDTHIHAAFLILDPAHLDRNIAVVKNQSVYGYQNGRASEQQSRVTGALDDDVDMQLLRTLQGKTTVIPVISKADTVTTKHMNVLKKTVWDALKKANLDPLEALGLDDNDDDSFSTNRIDEKDEEQEEEGGETTEEQEENGAVVDAAVQSDDASEGDVGLPIQGRKASPQRALSHKRLSSQSIRRHKAQEEAKEEETPFLPLSIISPDLYEPGVVGRKFPWGFADPYNEEHCDFQRLKEAVFSDWRAELREASREQWYEGWRTNKLKQTGMTQRR